MSVSNSLLRGRRRWGREGLMNEWLGRCAGKSGLPDTRNINAVALAPSRTRAQEIASVIDRLPEHLQPSKGSFEDIFSRACAEIALSARIDESGIATVSAAAQLYLARLLCGRSLASGDCHDACRLQHQCIGSSKLVMASFGGQARACIEALGLRVEADRGALEGEMAHRSAQHAPRKLRRIGSAA